MQAMMKLQHPQKHKGGSEGQNRGSDLITAWLDDHLLTCSEIPLFWACLSSLLYCWPLLGQGHRNNLHFSCLPILLKKLWKSWESPKAPKLECNRKPSHRLPRSCNLLSYANKIYATQCNSIKTKVHFHSCKVPKSSESRLSNLSVPSGDTVEWGSRESLVSRGQRGC